MQGNYVNSFDSSPSALQVNLEFDDKWGKIYMKNMLLIYLGKKLVLCTVDDFGHSLCSKSIYSHNSRSRLTVPF